MAPSCKKITLLVFMAVFAMKAKSQTEYRPSIGSSDSERCVCQPHVTINAPVCGRYVPVNPTTGCNSSTIEDIVSSERENTIRQVEDLQEIVSSELEDTRRKVDELQVAVSSNQETVSSELADTRRKVDELQVAVSGNQENVSFELQDIKQQLEMLQSAVTSIVGLLEGGFLFLCSPKDCSDILARGVTESGIYVVKPLDSGEPLRVYCDMETDGGGWTIFQRRQDGSVDFYLDFASYSRGFGDLKGEFWLGNDNLHRLTTQGEYELRVDLSDFENDTRYAVYDSFRIADVSDNYRLTLGSYSGTAGDSMSEHNNHQFSTKDSDNDANSSLNCAQTYHGAWWYTACHFSNLNGAYLRGITTEYARGVGWFHWKGNYYSLKTSEMKIRTTP